MKTYDIKVKAGETTLRNAVNRNLMGWTEWRHVATTYEHICALTLKADGCKGGPACIAAITAFVNGPLVLGDAKLSKKVAAEAAAWLAKKTA